ncbi:MAG: hypothetical protein WKF71_03720 [Pyrinomonadaceae bacterium]
MKFGFRLQDINVNVDVRQSEREKRIDEVLGGYLSEKEIADLPESGEDIKEELKEDTAMIFLFESMVILAARKFLHGRKYLRSKLFVILLTRNFTRLRALL